MSEGGPACQSLRPAAPHLADLMEPKKGLGKVFTRLSGGQE